MLIIFKVFFSFIIGKTALNVNKKNNVLWIVSGYILLFSSAAILSILKGILLCHWHLTLLFKYEVQLFSAYYSKFFYCRAKNICFFNHTAHHLFYN